MNAFPYHKTHPNRPNVNTVSVGPAEMSPCDQNVVIADWYRYLICERVFFMVLMLGLSSHFLFVRKGFHFSIRGRRFPGVPHIPLSPGSVLAATFCDLDSFLGNSRRETRHPFRSLKSKAQEIEILPPCRPRLSKGPSWTSSRRRCDKVARRWRSTKKSLRRTSASGTWRRSVVRM